MKSSRSIIGEIEQMAVDAIVHQPDGREAAEKHFASVAKKIVSTAMEAVDIMEIGDVCRRAVTTVALQDYDLLAKVLSAPDFDPDRLRHASAALASEKPVDFPPTVRIPSVTHDHAETAPGRAKGSMRSVKAGDHIAVVGYFDARRVVAEAEFAHPPCEDSPSPNVFGEGYVATVTRTDTDGTTKPVCKIDFANAGSVVCEKLLWCIVNCLKSYYGHRARNRANRHLRKIAALSPAAELAATVARQQGDDDLAQRLENA